MKRVNQNMTLIVIATFTGHKTRMPVVMTTQVNVTVIQPMGTLVINVLIVHLDTFLLPEQHVKVRIVMVVIMTIIFYFFENRLWMQRFWKLFELLFRWDWRMFMQSWIHWYQMWPMWLLLLQIIAIRVYKYANIKMMDFDDYFICAHTNI